jgi:mannobiose 2-epimerase
MDMRFISRSLSPSPADIDSVLTRHVIDVWFPRCLDRRYGGFLCDYDSRWRTCGSNDKLLEFQARHTWFAAEASQNFPENESLREATQHGFAYLRGALLDGVAGGWFHRLDRSGKPIEDCTKHSHGFAYAISACAAVYRATGDQSALELAREGFEWMDRYARDRDHGGYFGYLRRDGTIIRTGQDALPTQQDTIGTPVGWKDINVHSDLLETFAGLYPVWSDIKIADRLAEFAEIVTRRMASSVGAHYYYCLSDWTPVPHLTRFGYQFQSAFRLCLAAPFLADSIEILSMARRFVDHALNFGLDRNRGGFYYASTGAKPDHLQGHSLTVRRKLWWVQVEALKSLLAIQNMAPDEERYSNSFKAQWHYIGEHIIDHAFGGFRQASLEDLQRWRQVSFFAPRSYTLKGSDWKDCSHEGRALLYCLSVLKDRRGISERASVGSAGSRPLK